MSANTHRKRVMLIQLSSVEMTTQVGTVVARHIRRGGPYA